MAKVTKTSAHPESLILTKLDRMRSDNQVLFETVARLTELVGRSIGEAANVRADLAGMRTDLAHIKSDVVLLENQNLTRHGEVMNILHRLEPVEFAAREMTALLEPDGLTSLAAKITSLGRTSVASGSNKPEGPTGSRRKRPIPERQS